MAFKLLSVLELLGFSSYYFSSTQLSHLLFSVMLRRTRAGALSMCLLKLPDSISDSCTSLAGPRDLRGRSRRHDGCFLQSVLQCFDLGTANIRTAYAGTSVGDTLAQLRLSK